MSIIKFNTIRFNTLDSNIIPFNGVHKYGSCIGVPPIIPDIPEEPDVPINPDVDENGYIIFADPEVARICAENWGDGTGITLEQAAAVTSVGTVFKGNATITSFNEFGKFTKAQAVPANAFNGCTSLGRIDLGNVTSLGASALYNCSALEIDDLAMPNLTNLGQNAFYGVKIKKISNLGKITALPAASSATHNFGDKSVLEEVALPIGITKIGVYAFLNYTLLTGNFNLLSVTIIGGSAFQNTAITSIMLPLVNTISWNAFTDCKKLKFVKIGDSIEKIEAAAFQNCISLENVIIENTTPPTLSGTAFTNTNNCLIYVPDASVEAYKTATNWSSYASRIFPISQLSTDNPDLYNEIKDYL